MFLIFVENNFMEKVVIYCRVSTNKQKINSQVNNILNYCNKKDWQVVSYYNDVQISGLKNDRKGLNEMIEYVKTNKVTKIVVSELSRISRDPSFIKEFILQMVDLNISIFCVDIEIETMINGKLNFNSIPILMNEIDYSNREISKLQSRLRRGYDDYVQKIGTSHFGRKKGSKETESTFLFKHEDIIHYLNEGYSYRIISVITGKSVNTIMKTKKIMKRNTNWQEPKNKVTNLDVIKKIIVGHEDIVKEVLLFDEIKPQ